MKRMQLPSAKAREQGGRMRRHLRNAGFFRTRLGDEGCEVWVNGRRRVVLVALNAQEHDPVEAEVLDPRFRPDVALAYNAKGLAVLLARRPVVGAKP